jgi:hypothetical protein
MRWRFCPVVVLILKDCFINPSGLYLYPSGPSPSISASSSLPRPLSGVFPPSLLGAGTKLPPPLLPSISRYVRKLPETRLALHDLPSVHLRMPASRSSHTNTDPDCIDCLSFSDNLRCTRGKIPNRQASKSLIASAGLRTCPLYVSIICATRLDIDPVRVLGMRSHYKDNLPSVLPTALECRPVILDSNRRG